MRELLPPLLTAALYAVLGFHFWSATWRSTAQTTGALRKAPQWALLLPLGLHGILLYGSTFTASGLDFGLGNAMSAIAWLTVATYWLVNLRYNMAGMLSLVLPLAVFGVLLQSFFPAAHALPHSSLPLFKVHLAISMLAYSLLSFAALHAALMALVERRLHARSAAAPMTGLPPLLTMEQMLFQILTAGFVLLTLTLFSGVLFSEELFGKPLRLNHKTVFATLSWLIFAGLLIGRHWYGWRGRIAIRGTLIGFAMLLLAYIGSKFVLEVILHRI